MTPNEFFNGLLGRTLSHAPAVAQALASVPERIRAPRAPAGPAGTPGRADSAFYPRLGLDQSLTRGLVW